MTHNTKQHRLSEIKYPKTIKIYNIALNIFKRVKNSSDTYWFQVAQ